MEDFVGAKFYRSQGQGDGNQCIWIVKKKLEFPSIMLLTCTTNDKTTITIITRNHGKLVGEYAHQARMYTETHTQTDKQAKNIMPQMAYKTGSGDVKTADDTELHCIYTVN